MGRLVARLFAAIKATDMTKGPIMNPDGTAALDAERLRRRGPFTKRSPDGGVMIMLTRRNTIILTSDYDKILAHFDGNVDALDESLVRHGLLAIAAAAGVRDVSALDATSADSAALSELVKKSCDLD